MNDRFAGRTDRERRPRGLLVLSVLAVLAVVEARHPFYFLQDDCLSQNLPLYVANWRALCAFEFPLFNFHQFLGTPLLACLQSAAMYIPNYVAVGISEAVAGNFFYAVELLAAFHLVVAALGTYRLLRFLGCSERGSFFGGFAWPLSGFVMFVGNSWQTFPGYAAYVPWILLVLFRLTVGFDRRTFAVLVALRAILFSLGYPQMSVYLVLFEFPAMLLFRRFAAPSFTAGGDGAAPGPERTAAGAGGLRFTLGWYALHFAFTALLVAPVLLPAFVQVASSVTRKAPMAFAEYSRHSYDLFYWLLGLFHPYATVDGSSVAGWRNLHVLSHLGYVTLACFLGAIIFVRGGIEGRLTRIFLFLSALPLLFASNGTLIGLVYHVPLLNRFRYPFKFAFFTAFFMVVVAAFGWDRMERALAAARPSLRGLARALPFALLSLHVASAAWLYWSLPRMTFGLHRDRLPAEEPLSGALGDGRIASVGFTVWDNATNLDAKTLPTLGFNYATLRDLYQFGGYEYLVSERNGEATFYLEFSAVIKAERGVPLDIGEVLPLEYMRRWGVKWYLVDRGVTFRNLRGLSLAYADEDRNVYRDPLALPFAYWRNGTGRGTLGRRFNPNSMEIESSTPVGGDVVANVLYHENFRGYVDGRRVPIAEAEEWKIAVRVPPGRHTVRLVYVDPYFYGGLAAMLLFLGGTALAACLSLRRRRA